MRSGVPWDVCRVMCLPGQCNETGVKIQCHLQLKGSLSLLHLEVQGKKVVE
jgi:hypothetical protein